MKPERIGFSDSELEKRFEEAILKENFNLLQLAGFKANPVLSLLTGIAIGYHLGIGDFKDFIEG